MAEPAEVVPKAETGDERIEKKIREFSGYMKTLGIGVVVSRSGGEDLRECTRQLAPHNYDIIMIFIYKKPSGKRMPSG
nr:hypothetical protein [Clostridiales bacterium]